MIYDKGPKKAYISCEVCSAVDTATRIPNHDIPRDGIKVSSNIVHSEVVAPCSH